MQLRPGDRSDGEVLVSRVVVVAGWEFNTESLIDGVEWEITEVSGMGKPGRSVRLGAAGRSGRRVGNHRLSGGARGRVGWRDRAGSAAQVELASDHLRNLIRLAEFRSRCAATLVIGRCMCATGRFSSRPVNCRPSSRGRVC